MIRTNSPEGYAQLAHGKEVHWRYDAMTEDLQVAIPLGNRDGAQLAAPLVIRLPAWVFETASTGALHRRVLEHLHSDIARQLALLTLEETP